jgi:hypothetical protein
MNACWSRVPGVAYCRPEELAGDEAGEVAAGAGAAGCVGRAVGEAGWLGCALGVAEACAGAAPGMSTAPVPVAGSLLAAG